LRRTTAGDDAFENPCNALTGEGGIRL
jgi:hypothetical protein